MRKLPHTNVDLQAPPTLSARRGVLTVLLGLALAPLVYEGALLCASRWQAMYGAAGEVDTPVIDAIDLVLDEFSASARTTANAAFRNLPWKPALVIPLACAWAAFGAMLLRRR